MKSETDIRMILAGSDLFNGLLPSQLKHIATMVSVKDKTKGDRIFQLGEPANTVHVVAEGLATIVANPGSSEGLLDLCTPGRSFGVAAVLGSVGYQTSAHALMTSKYLAVSSHRLLTAFAADQSMAMIVYRNLARRLYQRWQGTAATAKEGSLRLVKEAAHCPIIDHHSVEVRVQQGEVQMLCTQTNLCDAVQGNDCPLNGLCAGEWHAIAS